MKNIHLLPTDKPTTLFKDDFNNFIYSINIDQEQNHFEPQHIYITSDEEIKEGDWVFNFEYIYIVQYDSKKHDSKFWYKKIILTTDQELIKDGVQTIDDEFLDWFVKNPSCEWVEVNHFGMCCGNQLIAQCINCNQYNPVYKIIIPKEEPKQETVGRQFHKTADMVISVVRNKETLEEAAKDYIENTMKFSFNSLETKTQANRMLKCVEFGAKWQAERMYSEEDLKRAFEAGHKKGFSGYPNTENWKELPFEKWFEQFKKK